MEEDQVVFNTPESIWIEQDGYNQLLNLMSDLSPLEKQASLLCDLQDCSQEQAALILDLKINTLKSHLSRGRKHFKSYNTGVEVLFCFIVTRVILMDNTWKIVQLELGLFTLCSSQ